MFSTTDVAIDRLHIDYSLNDRYIVDRAIATIINLYFNSSTVLSFDVFPLMISG